ncbi:uncharacterized protein LOC100877953 [Megachile rotundata]|uniref:uncharacterized protein LOC100877953 n=1 Tax=Megachile rotundata TaxID=143995 RepID=UPI003FD33AF2
MSTKAFGVLFLLLAAQNLCDAALLPMDKLDKLMPKNLSDKIPKNLNNVIPKDLLDKVPKSLDNVVPKDLLEKAKLPKDLGNNTLPKDLGNNTLPKDLLGNNTLPKDLLSNLPKDLLGNNTLPKDLLGNNTLPKDLLNKLPIDKNLLNKTLGKIPLNSTYLDPKTGQSLKQALEKSSQNPLGQLVSRGLGCECVKGLCNCCVGLSLPLIDGQKFCYKLELVPEDLELKTALSLNDKQLVASTLTGKNPPPLCVPLPHLNAVTICVRVYDLGIVGRNLKGCVDLETRLINAPVFLLHFDCMSMGLDGLSLSKPGSSEGLNLPKPQEIMQEIYDHVNFEPNKQEDNNDSSSSSDEDSQVGQLKY